MLSREAMHMSLFDKLKKEAGRSSQSFQMQMFTGVYPIDRTSFRDVFSACLGRMLQVQRAFEEVVIRGREFTVDLTFGKLKVGSEEYSLQFLGTESAVSGTWLWGWENINGLDENLLKLAYECRQKGTDWNLAQLKEKSFPLEEGIGGRELSVVACGISADNYAYIRYSYEGGTAFLTVSGLPAEVFAAEDVDRFATAVMQGIQRFDVDHKVFLESYLRWNGTPYEWDGRYLTAHFSLDLVVTFEKKDGLLRIAGMKTNRNI